MMKRSTLVGMILLIAVVGLWWWSRSEHSIARQSRESTFPEQGGPASGSLASEEPQSYKTSSSGKTPETSTVAVLSPGEGRVLDLSRMKPRIERKPSAQNLTDSSLFAQTPWKRWNGVVALPKQEGMASLMDVSGFSIVESNLNLDEENFYEGRSLVYFNSRTQVAGILTGIFRITLREGAELEELTEAYNLKVTVAYPHLQTYFVTAKESPFNLLVLKEKLKADPLVEDSEPELLSRRYEKF